MQWKVGRSLVNHTLLTYKHNLNQVDEQYPPQDKCLILDLFQICLHKGLMTINICPWDEQGNKNSGDQATWCHYCLTMCTATESINGVSSKGQQDRGFKEGLWAICLKRMRKTHYLGLRINFASVYLAALVENSLSSCIHGWKCSDWVWSRVHRFFTCSV